MKIAIPTNDQKRIFESNFDESQYYFVCEIVNGKPAKKQLIKNPYLSNQGEAQKHRDKILDLLEDCDLFMGRHVCELFLELMTNKEFEVVISSIDDIDEAIQSYLSTKLG